MVLLEFRQVRKTVGNVTLLPLLNLNIYAGQCIVIQCNYDLGNQLHQAVLAMTTIYEGVIKMDGKPLDQHTPDSLRKLVGVQLQGDGSTCDDDGARASDHDDE